MEEINKGHYFEVMDRTHCLMWSIQEQLMSHPCITPKQLKKLEKAQELLMEVYQWACTKHETYE